MTHDDTGLSAALRERVRDEDPDVDQLIRVSTGAGTRMRRRRTVGVSIAGVAAGVTVIGIIGASLGGSSGSADTEPGFATQPTAVASPSTPADVVPPDTSLPPAQDLPVHVAPSLRGWDIGLAADDKFPATLGDNFISVNVRPMSEYASWSGGDPDRPETQVVHRGKNYFVTVQPGPGAQQSAVAELVAGLRYQPVWRR